MWSMLRHIHLKFEKFVLQAIKTVLNMIKLIFESKLNYFYHNFTVIYHVTSRLGVK